MFKKIEIQIVLIASLIGTYSSFGQVQKGIIQKQETIIEKAIPTQPQTIIPVKKTENISWNGFETIKNGDGLEIKTLSFVGANYSPDESILPIYSKEIEGEIKTVSIQNDEYLQLSEEELKIIGITEIGKLPKIQTYLGFEYKKPITTLHIYPFKKNAETGKIEKLVSFNLKIEKSNQKTYSSAKTSADFATNSVLASGSWVKISVTSDGIYKIDKTALQSYGIDANSINPRNIRIHGFGGGMLPQLNSAARYDDLPENAIYVEGENDGVFNDSDYILFYGQGAGRWYFEKGNNIFRFEKNLYSDQAYYYITVGNQNGKRISTKSQATGATETFTDFDDRAHIENDLVNKNKSGREWVGEEFSSTLTRTYTINNFSNIISNSEMKFYSGVMANSPIMSNFNVKVNGTQIGTHNVNGISPGSYVPIGAFNTIYINKTANQIPNNSTLNIDYTYTKTNANSVGYHNFVTVNVKRGLQIYGNATYFRNKASITNDVSKFSVLAPTNSQIWDITNPINVGKQNFTVNGSSLEFEFASKDTVREFVVFTGDNFPSPILIGNVSNQNLHAISGVNMVIVSASEFLTQANELATIRNGMGINTVIITPQQIYEEFSSGRQDITAIRNFMKMLYDKSLATSQTTDDIKYLLLFGDCSYDYKNRITGNTNFVPIYEARESLSQVRTFSSDDYYGFLDDNEGDWVESSAGNNHKVDIGIGRFPVKTAEQANLVLRKIKKYQNNTPLNLGKWRNNITLLADDGDNCLHLSDAETFASRIFSNYPEYQVSKIYLDEYLQPFGSTGQISPDCKDAIKNTIDKGTLITNYTGHGNEVKLTSESIIDIASINSWRNYDKLTFMVTGTCEFGRYDDPSIISGAEHAFIMTEAAAIGLITTTRPVFSYSNSILNRSFYDAVLSKIDNNTSMPRLGDMVRITKNNSVVDVNNRNFALLGDPSMMLVYPQYDVTITKINDKSINSIDKDTLKALMKVTIEGNVSANAEIITTFNGKLMTTVYEKVASYTTLGNESATCDYTARKNVIFDGPVTVTNGLFKITFVVPKDINYQFGEGKIMFYADNSSVDANGYYNNIIIGGAQEGVAKDDTPPVINLFMDDESFVFGGLTGTNSLLIGKLFDDNGINTSGLGVGHDITAILDGDPKTLRVLNEFYTSELDNYQKGSITFPYKEIAPGPHNIKVKAWDTHNNSAEGYLEFIVANNELLALSHVLNYPNPFSTITTFHYDHNRAGDDMETKIDIYTVTGRLIKTLISRDFFSSAHNSSISWNGRDEYDDKIGNGVYVYKITVRSLRDGATKHQFEKLVILN